MWYQVQSWTVQQSGSKQYRNRVDARTQLCLILFEIGKWLDIVPFTSTSSWKDLVILISFAFDRMHWLGPHIGCRGLWFCSQLVLPQIHSNYKSAWLPTPHPEAGCLICRCLGAIPLWFLIWKHPIQYWHSPDSQTFSRLLNAYPSCCKCIRSESIKALLAVVSTV